MLTDINFTTHTINFVRDNKSRRRTRTPVQPHDAGRVFLGVCAIVYDENAYLQEWIAFHYALGARRFYIYENNPKDVLTTLLSKWIAAEIVVVIPFAGSGRQIEAYAHCMATHRHECSFMAIIDADEFIVPKQHPDILDFIRWHCEFRQNVGSIAINWVIFGDNHADARSDDPVISRFTRCHAHAQDPHVKCIFRSCAFQAVSSNPHCGHLRHGYVAVDADRNVLRNTSPHQDAHGTTHVTQINHYWSKSLQELRHKFTKELADHAGEHRTWDPAYGTPEWRLSVNAREDTCALRFLSAAIEAMHRFA